MVTTAPGNLTEPSCVETVPWIEPVAVLGTWATRGRTLQEASATASQARTTIDEEERRLLEHMPFDQLSDDAIAVSSVPQK
jgi:hypothetical protein